MVLKIKENPQTLPGQLRNFHKCVWYFRHRPSPLRISRKTKDASLYDLISWLHFRFHYMAPFHGLITWQLNSIACPQYQDSTPSFAIHLSTRPRRSPPNIVTRLRRSLSFSQRRKSLALNFAIPKLACP
jgi:hypothetical protein